jgi:catalase (peroxidase I)
MADPDGMDRPDVNMDALKSEIRRGLINQKANACPIAMRMAWHAAGTYDKRDGSGGCNGGTNVAARVKKYRASAPLCSDPRC